MQGVKSEESQAMAAIVSGSTRSLDDTSPPPERALSLQPHSSEEDPQVSGVEQAAVQQHKDEADLSIERVNICYRLFRISWVKPRPRRLQERLQVFAIKPSRKYFSTESNR